MSQLVSAGHLRDLIREKIRRSSLKDVAAHPGTPACGGRTRHVRGGAARVAAAVARTRFPHHRTARLQATARAVRKSRTPGDAVKQLNFVVEDGELVRINEGGIPIARLASTEEAELYALVDEL